VSGFRPVFDCADGFALSAGTQSTPAGTVLFADSNGVSFGMSGSSRVTASVDAVKVISAGGATAGGNLSFGNANSISFGVAGNTVTAAYSGIKAVSVDGGNRLDDGVLVLSSANNVAFGLAGSTLTASIPAGATATGNLGAVSAGTQLGSTGTILFVDSNGVSFGMAGSKSVTATFAAIKSLSAGTTRATGGEVVFSNSNGLSFGVNAQTVTASFASTMSYFENYKAAALSPNAMVAGSGNTNLSLQRVFVPWQILATQLDLLGHLTAATNSTGSYTWQVALYSYKNSTQASLLSSANGTYSFSSGSSQVSSQYGGHSGTRFRSVTLATWNVTPGEYMVGIMGSVAGVGTVTLFGQSSVSVIGEIGTNVQTQYWGDGVYSAGTGAFPTTMHRTQLLQAGSAAMRQPYFRLIGTF
jgi:hypothetical protein